MRARLLVLCLLLSLIAFSGNGSQNRLFVHKKKATIKGANKVNAKDSVKKKVIQAKLAKSLEKKKILTAERKLLNKKIANLKKKMESKKREIASDPVQ
ncbi:MAG: hypothetical protein AB7F59_09150 [Bdellovibrionales bacterium]